MNRLLKILKVAVIFVIGIYLLQVLVLLFATVRIVANDMMQPSFNVGDWILIEKISKHLGKRPERGDVVLFYPPPLEMGEIRTPLDVSEILGARFFSSPPAFVRRVIALPGETIKIEKAKGIYINGVRLNEDKYVQHQVTYSLSVLGDIQGSNVKNKLITPYADLTDKDKKITVPNGQYFVLGDNRENCPDSHMFGFVDSQQIIGKVVIKFGHEVQIVKNPSY